MSLSSLSAKVSRAPEDPSPSPMPGGLTPVATLKHKCSSIERLQLPLCLDRQFRKSALASASSQGKLCGSVCGRVCSCVCSCSCSRRVPGDQSLGARSPRRVPGDQSLGARSHFIESFSCARCNCSCSECEQMISQYHDIAVGEHAEVLQNAALKEATSTACSGEMFHVHADRMRPAASGSASCLHTFCSLAESSPAMLCFT